VSLVLSKFIRLHRSSIIAHVKAAYSPCPRSISSARRAATGQLIDRQRRYRERRSSWIIAGRQATRCDGHQVRLAVLTRTLVTKIFHNSQESETVSAISMVWYLYGSTPRATIEMHVRGILSRSSGIHRVCIFYYLS